MRISNRKLFIDLKYFSSACHSLALKGEEMADEFWKNDICADHGLFADLRIPAMRRTICGELQSQKLFLLGSILKHGVCATDLQRKPAGHSGLPSGGQTEDLSHGHSGEDFPQYAGPRQPDKRLAHLFRLCPSPDPGSPKALRQRFVWHRTGTNHLRAGRHNDRPLFIAFPLGNIPQEQGSGEIACASRSERQYPDDCFYYQRKGSRGQHPRQTAHRSRRHLHHGPRLSGSRASLQNASISCLLCNTRQEQRQIQSLLLPEDRQNNRTEIRSGCHLTRLLRQERLSREAQADCLLRRDSEQETGVSDQQLQITGPDHYGDLSQALADRVILQVDQAASANKSVLRHIRECGQNTNMDCDLHLCPGGDHQEAVESGAESLHDFTNCQRDAFRENTAFTSVYGY